MNNILKMFGKKQGLKLKENEESYIFIVGEDIFDDENIFPKDISEVLTYTVSTDDEKKSVALITDTQNTFYSIRVIDNDTGEYDVYQINFNKI